MDDRIGTHVLISGRVQGVGYRAWARHEALLLGLSGWVRNLGTGEVEAVACGPPDKVHAFVDACYAGPDWARVVDVQVLSAAVPVDGSFDILPDG